MKVVIRSEPSNVCLAKVWLPGLCMSSLLIFGKEFPGWRFLFASPFLVAGLFGASLAIVQLRDGVLRYRRLFKWTIIPEGEIVSARVVWPPFIGSIRLKRSLFPWGRLYFILDANSDPNPFRKGEYPLLRYIRKEPMLEDQDAEKWNSQKDRAAKLKLVAAAVAGALFYVLWQFFYSWRFSRFGPAQPVHAPRHDVIDILLQISQLWGKFEVVFILCVVFTFLAIYKYRRPDAWIYAFLAGAALPRILLHWL